MDPYVWRGSKELTRLKSKWNFEPEKVTVTVGYVGPYSVLITACPKPGMVIPDFDLYGLTVYKCEITEGDGDSGTGEVTLETVHSAGDTTTAPIGQPIYEIDWTELTKALETHPKCGILKDTRPRYAEDGTKVTAPTGGHRRKWDDWADLDANDYDDTGGKWSLATYQAKRRAGIESYNIGAPVVRRTLYYQRPPTDVGENVWKQQEPPGLANAPEGYQWVLSCDSLTKEGRKRTRKSEWLGATTWDDDLYPDA